MFITLKTERLVLRPLSIDDLYSTHAYAGNPENTKFMVYLPNGTLEETKNFLSAASAEWEKENPDFYEFALVRNRHIGAISVYLDESRSEGELGWIIHKDFWGNGYATEAAFAIKDFAAKELGLKKLIAHCDGQNAASYHVMSKIGMTLEHDDGFRYNKNAQKPTRELIYSLSLERKDYGSN